MPVTARLSRAFYERLGDDVANELVDWFNQVDLTYRSELRAELECQTYFLLRWMFPFWVTTLLGIAGLYLRP